MTPEERMARAEALAVTCSRFSYYPFNGIDSLDCSEVAAVLRGLINDLRRSEGLAEELATALRARDAEVTRLHAARSELEEQLADLRAQVVSALSAAGPCEDERSA